MIPYPRAHFKREFHRVFILGFLSCNSPARVSFPEAAGIILVRGAGAVVKVG